MEFFRLETKMKNVRNLLPTKAESKLRSINLKCSFGNPNFRFKSIRILKKNRWFANKKKMDRRKEGTFYHFLHFNQSDVDLELVFNGFY